ncbi:molybdenum cofactor guanylyltransferase [Algoriphagus sp. AGSA1]|jgi:molybdopterin-guanine dinucleotide biosynthesis protein A|nr:molybdenum cofactor guanylyltransferase [Algoriphagus sp. AGSA1]
MSTQVISADHITGLVLAGGQGSRMGADKAALELGGETLTARAQRYLAARTSQVWLSANQTQQGHLFAQVLADDPVYGAQAGPLAGVATALAAITTPWLLTLPVDIPWLPNDLHVRLAEAVRLTPAKVAYARTKDRDHPLCMLVHQSLAASLHHYLLGGDRKVLLWLHAQQAVPVTFNGDEALFANLNTPEDLAWARRRLGEYLE